jgi:hypothetical protein
MWSKESVGWSMPWAAYIRALKGGSASAELGGTLRSIRPELSKVAEIFY